MTVNELLAELAAARVRLSLNGGRLHVLAPPGAVTPELRAAGGMFRIPLAEHKAALLAQMGEPLTAKAAAPAADGAFRIPLNGYDEYLRAHRLRVVGGTRNGPNGEPALFVVEDRDLLHRS